MRTSIVCESTRRWSLVRCPLRLKLLLPPTPLSRFPRAMSQQAINVADLDIKQLTEVKLQLDQVCELAIQDLALTDRAIFDL